MLRYSIKSMKGFYCDHLTQRRIKQKNKTHTQIAHNNIISFLFYALAKLTTSTSEVTVVAAFARIAKCKMSPGSTTTGVADVTLSKKAVVEN